MGFSTKQTTFINAANDYFLEIYTPIFALYNDSTQLNLFKAFCISMNRRFALNRINSVFTDSASESLGVARGIVGWFYLHRHVKEEQQKTEIALKIKELQPAINFFKAPPNAKDLFNQYINYTAKRFGPVIERLANTQNGIANLAHFFAVEVLEAINEYSTQTTELNRDQKINFLVKKTTQHKSKKQISWQELTLEATENDLQLNQIVYESPIQCGKDLFLYTGDGHGIKQNVLAPQIISNSNEFDARYYEKMQITYRLKGEFTIPIATYTKENGIPVDILKKQLNKFSNAISSIEGYLEKNKILCLGLERLISNKFKIVEETMVTFDKIQETDEYDNLEKTFKVNCKVLKLAIDRYEFLFKNTFSDKTIKIVEGKLTTMLELEYHRVRVNALAASTASTTFASSSTSSVSFDSSVTTLKIPEETRIPVPNMHDTMPIETRFRDIMDFQLATHFDRDEKFQLKTWYEKLAHWALSIVQAVPLLLSDLTRNLVRSIFLAIRHPEVLLNIGVQDDNENLNEFQKSIKSIGLGIDDFLARNFNALTHPLDTISESMLNLVNSCINFIYAANKYDLVKDSIALLWDKFKQDPLRYATDTALTLASFVVVTYYTAHVSKAFSADRALAPSVISPVAALPATTLGLVVSSGKQKDLNHDNESLSASTSTSVPIDEVKLHKDSEDIDIKNTIEILINSLAVHNPFEDVEAINQIHQEILSLQNQFTDLTKKETDYYTQYLNEVISHLNESAVDADDSCQIDPINDEIQKLEVFLILYKNQMYTSTCESVFVRSEPVDPTPVSLLFKKRASTENLAPLYHERDVIELATASF